MLLFTQIFACMCWWTTVLLLLGSPTDGLVIKDVHVPVVLQNIPFDFSFNVEYERQDEVASLDALVAIISTVNGGRPLKTANFTVFDEKNKRKTAFVLQNLLLSDLGLIDLSLMVYLADSSTLPSNMETYSTTTSNNTAGPVIQQAWVIPGGYTLIPLAVTMVVAVISRNVLPALFCGVLTATFLIYSLDLPTAFARSLDSIILTSLTDPNNQLVILFAMVMGGFVNMVNESGGSVGLANALARWAKSGSSTQFVTLFFGLMIFFDDYASALILGATLRTVADRMSVSREKFCFLVDSGAAPIAALVPITSWTAFESALLQVEADKILALGLPFAELGYETSGFLGLLKMLKYAYYSIFLLFFQVFMIGTGREFGPMFVAERKALIYGVTDERYHIKESSTNADAKHDPDRQPVPPRCCNAGIPILFFVIYSISAMVVLGAAAVPVHEQIGIHNIFSNVDSITVMYYGATLATFLAALLYRLQSIPIIQPEEPSEGARNTSRTPTEQPVVDGRVLVSRSPGLCARLCCGKRSGKKKTRRPLMTCNKSVESFVEGFTHLTSTIMVLVLAWSIGSAVDYLGAGRYLAMTLEGNVPPSSLPTLIFAIACIVAFATGSSWATMAVLYPICGPLAYSMSLGNPEVYYCSMAAILEGSVFGDHCSFISDTTIMSAMACKCPLTSHVTTQLPYAIFCATISLSCGYVPIGLQTMSVASTYFVGFAATALGVLVIGANPRGDKLDLLNWIYVQMQTKCFRENPDEIAAVTLLRIPVENAQRRLRKGKNTTMVDATDNVTNPQQNPSASSLRRASFEGLGGGIPENPENEHTGEKVTGNVPGIGSPVKPTNNPFDQTEGADYETGLSSGEGAVNHDKVAVNKNFSFVGKVNDDDEVDDEEDEEARNSQVARM